MSNQNQDMKDMIEESVSKAVNKSMRRGALLGNAFDILFKLAIVAGLVFMYFQLKPKRPDPVEPVDNHDVTLENNGIFGFTVADFEEVILGEATRKQLLIVDEQEVSVPSSITNTGLWNLNVFTKVLNLTVYGRGQYTIDLTKINKNNISLDEDTYTVTIHVPYPELHGVTYLPDKTKFGDTEKGWLAFGDLKLTPEQTQQFEVEAVEKLNTRLNEQDCFATAERFAKLTAYELYQPLVSSISPAYKVEIIVDPK